MNSPVKAHYSFDEIYRLSKRHAERFGWDATNEDIRLIVRNGDIRLIVRSGHVVPLSSITPAQRQELAAKWTLDIEQDRQRARAVAGKPDAKPNQEAALRRRKYRDAPERRAGLGPVAEMLLSRREPFADASARRFPQDERDRRLRRGPIRVEGVGYLRPRGLVTLADGRQGRIAACEGRELVCERLVIVMDDCTTRVLTGLVTREQIKSVYYDGGMVRHA